MIKLILVGILLLMSIVSTGALLYSCFFNTEITAGPEDEYFND